MATISMKSHLPKCCVCKIISHSNEWQNYGSVAISWTDDTYFCDFYLKKAIDRSLKFHLVLTNFEGTMSSLCSGWLDHRTSTLLSIIGKKLNDKTLPSRIIDFDEFLLLSEIKSYFVKNLYLPPSLFDIWKHMSQEPNYGYFKPKGF